MHKARLPSAGLGQDLDGNFFVEGLGPTTMAS